MKRQLSIVETREVLQKLESYNQDLQQRWTLTNPIKKSWFKLPHDVLIRTTRFMIDITDELVLFVENLIPEGTDKKAAVLYVASKLFDYIVSSTFPVWLLPIASTMKTIVVTIILSQMIDYMVNKYNAGYWEKQTQAGG